MGQLQDGWMETLTLLTRIPSAGIADISSFGSSTDTTFCVKMSLTSKQYHLLDKSRIPSTDFPFPAYCNSEWDGDAAERTKTKRWFHMHAVWHEWTNYLMICEVNSNRPQPGPIRLQYHCSVFITDSVSPLGSALPLPLSFLFGAKTWDHLAVRHEGSGSTIALHIPSSSNCVCVCVCVYYHTTSLVWVSVGYTRLPRGGCMITIHSATMSSSDFFLTHTHTCICTQTQHPHAHISMNLIGHMQGSMRTWNHLHKHRCRCTDHKAAVMTHWEPFVDYLQGFLWPQFTMCSLLFWSGVW